jgi:hypothetical protein
VSQQFSVAGCEQGIKGWGRLPAGSEGDAYLFRTLNSLPIFGFLPSGDLVEQIECFFTFSRVDFLDGETGMDQDEIAYCHLFRQKHEAYLSAGTHDVNNRHQVVNGGNPGRNGYTHGLKTSKEEVIEKGELQAGGLAP